MSKVNYLFRDLCILGVLIYAICFWRLNDESFHIVDESYHAKATQEMLLDGHFFRPTAFGVQYNNKPPFKMWLSTIPVYLFGQSNFSYRFIDAVCGGLTVLLLYLFSLKMFQSGACGVLAGALLLGCESYIFNHGVRTATQDSMLVFLVTLAMYASWIFITEEPHARRSSIVGGSAIGLAVLTKNIVGFLPFVILLPYLLVSGKIPLLLNKQRKNLLITITLALIIPATYLLPRCIESLHFFKKFFGFEIVSRAFRGFHNTGKPFFYLEGLFLDRLAVPPEMLIPAICLAIFWFYYRTVKDESGVSRRDLRFLFLLSWAITPVILFSLAKSKLPWYLSPAFPGMSLLVASVFIELLRSSNKLSKCALCLILFFPALHLIHVLKKISAGHPRLELDLVQEEMKHRTAIFLGTLPLARHEKVYKEMFDRPLTVFSKNELQESFKVNTDSDLLVPIDMASQALGLIDFNSYSLLAPNAHRKKWGVFLSSLKPLNDGGIKSKLRLREVTLDLSVEGSHVLHGLGPSYNSRGMTLRQVSSNKAEFLVLGDKMHQELGAKLKINLVLNGPNVKSEEMRVLLNGEELGSLSIPTAGFQTRELLMPGSKWLSKKNVISLNLVGIQPEAQMAINWIKVDLESRQSK